MLRKKFFRNDAYRMFGLIVFAAVVLSLTVSIFFPNLNNLSMQFWIIQGAFSLLLGSIAVLYAKFFKVDFLASVGFKRKPKVMDCLMVVTAIFFLINGMTPVNEWFCDFIEFLGLPRPKMSITVESVEQNLFFAIAAICVVAPVSEELIFRGVIGNGLLNSRGSKVSAIFFGGLLFSLFHMRPAQTVHQFLVGSVLMLFLFSSGSIWTVLIGHTANNIFAVTFSLTIEKTGFYQDYAVLSAVLGLFLFAVVTALYIFLRRKTILQKEEEQKSEKENPSSGDVLLLSAGLLFSLIFWILNLL